MPGVSPSIGVIKRTTTHETRRRPRTTLQSVRDKEPARTKEDYRQQRLAEHDERRGQLGSDTEHSTALNIKELVLEVYALHVRQLAAEENYVKVDSVNRKDRTDGRTILSWTARYGYPQMASKLM